MANISIKQKEMSLKIIQKMQLNYINLKILKSQIITRLSITTKYTLSNDNYQYDFILVELMT